MQLLSNLYNFGFIIFVSSFILLSWKYFLELYRYNKIFDFTFVFIGVGYFIERLFFVLINRKELIELGGLDFFSFDKLPLAVLDLHLYTGFSFIVFFMGGLIGLFLYNSINTVNKLGFGEIEGVLRIFLISLTPWICILIIGNIVLFGISGDKQMLLVELIPSLMRLLVIVFVLGIHKMKIGFWGSKPGLFLCLVVLLIALIEIFIDYIDPSFAPVVLGLFSAKQVISILLIILAINIFLTTISNLQDSIIRKKLEPIRQIPSRGFALSFANKRRVSNPLNIRLKNLTKNASRHRKNHEL